MTAAEGVAAGLGRIGTALLGLVFTLFVLSALAKVERRLGHRALKDAENKPGSITSSRVDP